MGAQMDSLEIGIQASTIQANRALDSLVSKLQQISTQLGIGSNAMGRYAGSVNSLTAAMSGFKNSGVKGADFTRIVTGLNKLSTVDSSGINRASGAIVALTRNLSGMGNLNFDSQGLLNIANSISKFGSKTATSATANLPQIRRDLISFVQGLNGIGALNFDMTGLANLVSSITRLGGKSATNSIPNIQALGTALRGLITTLSTAPHVSQNVIQLANALANLASNGARVSTASQAMRNNINRYSSSSRTATRHTKSLASAIGMFYAKCFLAIRAVKLLWKAIKSSMDYIETLNYFDAAWGQVSDKAIGQWQEAGYDSADAYAKSFGDRAKELTGKMTGFQPDGKGDLAETGLPSLGINPNLLMNYQATFGQMASSMGVTSENALKLSNALTMIGADLASVKNLNFKDVWNDMASGLVGMSRTLDKYGVNIRNVNLQEKLSELGIKAKINTLNQQDKALLRTIILLDSTKYAWGDMSRTIEQPANQLRLLQSNFSNLARAIGNLFLPIVAKVLPYINALVIALQRLFTWLGGLIGIKVSDLTSSMGSASVNMGDFADEADDAAGSLDDANSAAKKLKGTLAGWDELENRSSKEDSAGSGSGAGGVDNGLLDDAFNQAIEEYQKAWDAAFANMSNRAQEMADSVIAAFKKIWDMAEPTREALKRLWNEGFAQLSNFTWTALQDFWNKFLVPLGNWSLGTGFPMLIDAINNFLTSINWTAINDALRNFWQVLEPFAEKVGEGLIEFFDDLLKVGAGFINFTVPNGISAIAEALKKISPQTAKDIGYALGVLATSLVAFKGIKTIAAGIGTLSINFGKVFKVAGVAKYGAIALGIGGVVLALDKFGYIDVNWGTLSNAFKKLAAALGKFAIGIGKGLLSFVDGLLKVMSPALEGLINGFAWALDGLGGILNAIPERAITSLTKTLVTFFAAWKTYAVVTTAMTAIRTAWVGITNAFLNAGFTLELMAESGSVLSVLAQRLGPTALGGIAFAGIATGLFLIADSINKATEEAAKNSAIGQFSQAISDLNDEVSQKTSQIQTSLANTRHEIETTGVAESQVAKDLAAEYKNLSSKSGLTAESQARMRDISNQLVDLVPGLSKYIDEQTGYLDIQNQTLEDLINNQELYAQKQAAQEYLVQAYKNQYEAQMNVKNAQDGYNKAFNEYLASAGLAPDIIKQIRDNQLDLNQADVDFQNSPNTFKEKYGVDNMNVLRKAIKGLSEEMDVYNTNLGDAEQTVVAANSSLDSIKNTIYESEKEYKKHTEAVLADKLASDEYKQSLSDLQTTFANLDINLSKAFMQDLTIDEFDPAVLENFFSSIKDGIQASSSDLKSVFENLGLSLPDDLAKAIAQKTPVLQSQIVKMLMSIQSGIQAKEGDLNTLFQNLGIELPDNLIKNLAGKEPAVQTTAVNLLSKIEAGYSLTQGNLKTLFSTLGLEVPSNLISSLESKEADVQLQAITLLGQIKTASDSERDEIIQTLNDLGIDSATELGKGIESEQESVATNAKNLANTVKLSVTEELNPTDKSSGSIYDAGANASKGFWQGLKDNWDDSWLGKKINELKQTITGKDGLEINSPSRILRGYGAFAGIGFNTGFKDEMDKTVPMTERWMDSIRAFFNSYSIALPGSGISYSFDTPMLPTIDAAMSIRVPDNLNTSFGLDVTADLTASMKDVKDAKSEMITQLRRQNELLEVIANKPVIDKNDIGSAYISYAKTYRKQTGKQLGISY